MPRSCSTLRLAGAGSWKRSSYILRTTFRRRSSSSASLAWYSRRSARAPPGWPLAYRRTPDSPTHTSRVLTVEARCTAAWETRVPGSSMMQATEPTGMCVRIPVLSITTKAPS
ncbi:hypothetical protein D9M70_460270 [compost metagenome]